MAHSRFGGCMGGSLERSLRELGTDVWTIHRLTGWRIYSHAAKSSATGGRCNCDASVTSGGRTFTSCPASNKQGGILMNIRMKAAQISKAGGDRELVERDIPEPGPRQVRVKVDWPAAFATATLFVKKRAGGPEFSFLVWRVMKSRDASTRLARGVTRWNQGQRVGVGWHGGHCFVCDQCRRGDFAMCVDRKVTGIDFDGGYAEYMIAREETLAAIPEELPAEEAGPFMCAGVTVFNALRNSGARGGTWWQCKALAGSDISGFSTHGRWDSRRSRSAGRTRSPWPRNWVLTIILIPAQATWRRSCKSSAARA